MKKEYVFVLIAYVVMQLSSVVGVPLFAFIATETGMSIEEAKAPAMAYWSIFSFFAALIAVLFFLRKEMRASSRSLNDHKKASVLNSVIWSVLGIFLAFFSQSFAIMIENLIGVKQGSENTQFIVNLISAIPLFALVSSVVGPILEEIVFRKIIFGSLYKKMNFFFSALISSIIFGFAHFEPEHIILYSAMGFTFAFLYVKTNRILVPIAAHVAMNTMVVIVQIVNKDEIEKMLNDMEQVQSFIGGLL